MHIYIMYVYGVNVHLYMPINVMYIFDIDAYVCISI